MCRIYTRQSRRPRGKPIGWIGYTRASQAVDSLEKEMAALR